MPLERLDSWKAVAAYLKRDVITVQRWERREGMPVHRHIHNKRGSVYALSSELDAWRQTRAALLEKESELEESPTEGATGVLAVPSGGADWVAAAEVGADGAATSEEGADPVALGPGRRAAFPAVRLYVDFIHFVLSLDLSH